MYTDSLTSLVTGMGTDRDFMSTITYATPTPNEQQYRNAWRVSALARRIVEQPAKDCFRKWREWQAEGVEISAIEAVEKDLNIREKLEDAKVLARLVGVAYVYISVNSDPSEPLDPATVGKDGLLDALVLGRADVAPGDIETNALSAQYGKPKYYEVTGDTQLIRIHPSRMVVFFGVKRPYEFMHGDEADSVLMSVMPAVQRHEHMVADVAYMMTRACIDVITVPGLSKAVQDDDQRDALMSRFSLMKQMQANRRVTILDGADTPDLNGEEWDQYQVSFATIPDVVEKDQEELCAAAEMPRALLFGTSAGGLGSTGNLELSNYYDRINSIQSNEIEPSIALLDECIIRSALGSRPDDLWYQWASLWQVSDSEKADIGTKTADKWSKLVAAGIIPGDAATQAVINDLTEKGIGGGIDQFYNDWIESGGTDDEEDMIDDVNTSTA